MEIRTVILDDSAPSRLAAATALRSFEDVEIVGQFGGSRELYDFLASHTAHLIFLDIELDEELGFSVARRLRETHPGMLVVFLTGHSSYAIDGYGFQPVNFLTKPINPGKLAETMEEVRRRLRRSREQRPAQLMFRLSQGYRILDVRDIVYIERLGRKNILHTEGEELRVSNYTMRELEEMLSEHGFFLCHQSFLISLWRVEAIRDARRQLYEARLRGAAAPIPVSRVRYEALLEALAERGIVKN